MSNESLESSKLWKSTLAARSSDPHEKYRDRLRTSLLTMRANVKPLVGNIHRDILGLTVHDETHLDELWQTASCLACEDFALNPVEAFVFGAAVLLHDTGLAVAAYPGGIADLKETGVWKDAEAGIRARSSKTEADGLTRNEEHSVLFSTLRKLHAEQAEKLVYNTYRRPRQDEAIPLLQDVELKDAFGSAIGRIAHSHHWDAGDIVEKLLANGCTAPGFPPEWTLNEIKVACLLRCADAAHIDALRAPTMLFAISDIGGHSLDHWEFQNKINKVTRTKDKLQFVAGTPFKIEDASSWWLAHDTLKMVDNEIKSCNAILEEIGETSFAASGVNGIESPRLLSKLIRVEGWNPVNAEVKVSDPVHLARTLGGRNLYGHSTIAPVRELLQNAADAIRARRKFEDRSSVWGKIKITIENCVGEDSDTWIHVDDTGIGMSERVLTGPLIDFGKSFWSSSLVEDEFPGLRGANPQLVGKFGIGFFSVFLLGNSVRIISKRYDAGDRSTLVLYFDELTRRPLMRPAVTGELPQDYSTRVSVKLNSSAVKSIEPFLSSGRPEGHPISFVDRLKHMTVGVNVDVEIVDRVHNEQWSHSGEWETGNVSAFLDEVCATQSLELRESIIKDNHDRVRLIKEEDGKVVGRAALMLPEPLDADLCVISVGGFSTKLPTSRRYYYSGEDYVDDERTLEALIGVVGGETDDASREFAKATVSQNALSRWAEEQESLVDLTKYTPPTQVAICHTLIRLGSVSDRLPFGFVGGDFCTVSEIRKRLKLAGFMDIPLTLEDYKTQFKVKPLGKLNTQYFTSSLHPTVIVANLSSVSDLLNEEKRKEVVRNGGMILESSMAESIFDNSRLRYLRDLAVEEWGCASVCSIQRVDLADPSALSGSFPSWALRLSKLG